MAVASDYVKLTDDEAQQALYRLAALDQYLYDTMNGDPESHRYEPDPLPGLAMDYIRIAQRAIHEATRIGQRHRPETLGGQLVLSERTGSLTSTRSPDA